MRILKNILSQLHRFVFWAILLSLFWAWIFLNFVGDTSREKKVLVYVDAYGLERHELAVRLEEEGLPEGIKMIQVRSFDYDLFGSSLEGDLYLMRESILRGTLEESPEKLAAISLPAGTEGYVWQDQVYGLRIYDPATGQGAAAAYVQYTSPYVPEQEAYYLCFDAAGPHLESCPGALDNAAWDTALRLLALDD